MKPASDERTPDGGGHFDARDVPEQLMDVRRDERSEAVVITVDGDVDGLTAPRLAAAIRRAFDGLGERRLVLDLTRVVFMGSAGLRTLTECTAEATRRHGPRSLRVVVDHARPVIRPIEIVGLDDVLTLHESVDDALDAGEHP